MLPLVTSLGIDEAILSYVSQVVIGGHGYPCFSKHREMQAEKCTNRKGRSNIYPCLSEHRKMQARLEVVGDIKDQGRNELRLSTLIQ